MADYATQAVVVEFDFPGVSSVDGEGDEAEEAEEEHLDECHGVVVELSGVELTGRLSWM